MRLSIATFLENFKRLGARIVPWIVLAKRIDPVQFTDDRIIKGLVGTVFCSYKRRNSYIIDHKVDMDGEFVSYYHAEN